MNIRINQTIADQEGMSHYRQLHDLLKPHRVRHQVVIAYQASATYAIQRDRAYAPTTAELFEPVTRFTTDELTQFFHEVQQDISIELSGPERWIQQYYFGRHTQSYVA